MLFAGRGHVRIHLLLFLRLAVYVADGGEVDDRARRVSLVVVAARRKQREAAHVGSVPVCHTCVVSASASIVISSNRRSRAAVLTRSHYRSRWMAQQPCMDSHSASCSSSMPGFSTIMVIACSPAIWLSVNWCYSRSCMLYTYSSGNIRNAEAGDTVAPAPPP